MTTTKEIPAFQLETIYRIMLKRISKGYTAEQLTFLIGAPERHVQDIEALEKPFYSSDDLERMVRALEESNPQSFFPLIDDETILKISFKEAYHAGKKIYTYCRIDEQGEEEELYTVKEDAAPDFDQIPGSEKLYRMAKDAIQLLIQAGYFYEAKLPLEIYQTINRFIGYHLSPFILHIAMLWSCETDREQPLKVIDLKEGAFAYEN